MDNPVHSNSHVRFAGRTPAGTAQPVTLTKNGVHHKRRLADGRERDIMSVGLACSECFSGPNLHKVLKPGFEFEMKVMKDLMESNPAAPLSIHTSSGVPEALSEFLHALEPHLPWKEPQNLDWVCSLQLEGASAVWAAIDMLIQVQMIETGNKHRTKVAVGSTSYHGPPSTSFGSKSPLWHKHYQLQYPAPLAGSDVDGEDMLASFNHFMEQNATDIGVILFEPQWGSSQAGMPWPKNLLKQYIDISKNYGIKVLCDEIMCGLGRHGQGSLFLSEAWDLDPDAVTFGKAVAAGCFPLSGAILKTGRDLLQVNKASVMQSHTYAGSSARALMAATAVLKEIPTWIPCIVKQGHEMQVIFRYINKISNGLVTCHGQGLMWGGIFSRDDQCKDPVYRQRVIDVFKKYCDAVGILPYHVPVGGFMVSPVLDIDVGTIYEMGQRLEEVLMKTVSEVGWEPEDSSDSGTETASPSDEVNFNMTELDQMIYAKDAKCLTLLHKTKSCTSCSDFVCQKLRTRFMNYDG